MTRVDCSDWDVLGGWAGYRVERSERELAPVSVTGRDELWLWLEPTGPAGLCDGCRQPAASIHDSEWRLVRDLPVFESDTYLAVRRRRVDCPRCGPRLELECARNSGHLITLNQL